VLSGTAKIGFFARGERVLCLFPLAPKMSTRNAIATVVSVIVAGVVIAGATIGWPPIINSITSLFSSATIESSAAGRPSSGPFFAGEKIWLQLKGAKVERVYWLFDESDKIESSGVQVQHAFPFDDKASEGAVRYHRIDAFFRSGERYKSASTRVETSNQKLAVVIGNMMDAVRVLLADGLPGKRSLAGVSLAKYSKGRFETTAAVPVSFEPKGLGKEAVFSFSDIASAFDYKSADDAKKRLSEDSNIWVSADYTSPDGKKPVTIVKKLTIDEKPK
jgi:hypothetical protein